MNPFFSIIIPTFNRAAFLRQSIGSVINQKFQDWECIIVDDGSTDDTKGVVLSFNEPRIKYFYKKNEERSIARNFGIAQAKGRYICFLDSDDIYYPSHLAAIKKNIQEEGYPVGIFYTGINEKRGDRIIPRPIFSSCEYDHPLYFVWEKFMLPNGVCIHHKILEKHKFPKKFNVWEDTHLWLRITAIYPFFQIQQITTQWNIHPKSSVSKAFQKVETIEVKKYLECIEDLFSKYSSILHPYLSKEDKQQYQWNKLQKFMNLSLIRYDYKTFFNLYFMGLRFVDMRKLNKFALPLLKQRTKKRLRRIFI